jgi:hypothetical protein
MLKLRTADAGLIVDLLTEIMKSEMRHFRS